MLKKKKQWSLVIDHAKEKEAVVTGEDTNLLLVVLLLKFLHAPPPLWVANSIHVHSLFHM